MRTDNQRRSDNFEDRGRGGGGGGVGAGVLFAIFRRIGIRGSLILVAVLAGAYFLVPGVRPYINQVTGLGGGASSGSAQGEGSTCAASAEACDFSQVVLAATEDVWTQQFAQARVPGYGRAAPSAYALPTLRVFTDNTMSGCGPAQAAMGPFYCPTDNKLYLDPTFFDLMRDRLHSPGDFAQAYVIAHEVGHHVQNLTGAINHSLPGEDPNQTSVRIELQADCLAGVWGHHKRADLVIDDADLSEALTAADAIGDDALTQGRADPREYTHGTSRQRVRWFRQGFASGDARQCDTFAVAPAQL
jgi:uncharacterized protein